MQIEAHPEKAGAQIPSNALVLAGAGIDLITAEFRIAAAPIALAGFPSPAADYLEDRIDLNQWLVSNPAATFFIRVSGDSMVDAGLLDKDVVAVDRSISPAVRHIVVAIFEGTFYVKRLLRISNRLALCSENALRISDYPPLYLDTDSDHKVWGVVAGAVRKY